MPPLVGFGVLTTNLVEGLMCLWELQDNTGSSTSLIRFIYRRWPLKNVWRHWRQWWYVKIFTLKTMTWEDIGWRLWARRLSFVVSFSSLLSHRNHRTVKWGPSEQSQIDWCDAQPKFYVFKRRQWEQILSRAGWVSFACSPSKVAACVWNLTVGTCVSSLVTQSHFGQIRSSYPVAINSPPPTP